MSGRIKGITVVIGGDTTGLEKSLKNVNDTIRKTQSSLKDVNKLLKLDPTNTTLLTQKQGYLKTAIDATKQKLEALKDAQAQAKSQMESGDLGAEKYKALQREVISTEEDLKKLEDQAEKEKTALDKIGDVGAKFSELGDNVADAGKKLLPLSATIAAVGTASMAAWHQLDDAYDNITAKTGATGEKAEELHDTFDKVFGSLPVESQDASDAIAGIEQRLGLTGNALTTVSEQFLKFAEVNDTDVTSAVTNVSKAMNDAGISGTQASQVLDQLTAASQASGIGVDRLTELLSLNGVTMRQLGYSITDTIALLATMEKNGVDVGSVLTGLKYATKTYAAENKDASTEIKTLFDNIKNGSASAADAQAVFGSRAGEILYEYVKEGKLDFSQLADAIQDSNGRVSETFEDMEDPVDKMKVAYNNLKLAGASLGDSLNTVLAPVFNAVAKACQMLANTMLSMPDPIKDVVAALGTLVAVGGPGLITVGTGIKKFGDSLTAIKDFGQTISGFKDTFTSFGGTIKSFGTNFTGVGALFGGLKTKVSSAVTSIQGLIGGLGGLNPVVLAVVAVIAVLSAAFITLWKNNDQFRQGIINAWNQVSTAVGTFVSALQTIFSGFSASFGGLMSTISAAWNAFCNALAPVFTGAFNILATVLTGVLDVLTGILNVFIGIFTGNWTTCWNGVQTIFSSVWNMLSGIVTNVVAIIEGIIQGFISLVTGVWSTGWTGIQSIVEGVWNGISSFIGGILSAIAGTISGIMSGIAGTISSIWSVISSTVSSLASGIASAVGSRFNAMRNTVSSIFNGIRSIASSTWNGIRSTISSVASGISGSVRSIFSDLSSGVTSIFSGLRGRISGIFAGIQSAIIGPVQRAMGVCRNAANAIRSAFSSIHISIPHFALPHLSVSGSFSINPPSVPHFGISWYKEGGILQSPTIFGMGQSTLLAGGEAGKEAVLPLDSFYAQLERIMSKGTDNSKMESLLSVIAENSSKGIYLDNGVLVGYLLPAIDTGLGKKHKIQRRMAV